MANKKHGVSEEWVRSRTRAAVDKIESSRKDKNYRYGEAAAKSSHAGRTRTLTPAQSRKRGIVASEISAGMGDRSYSGNNTRTVAQREYGRRMRGESASKSDVAGVQRVISSLGGPGGLAAKEARAGKKYRQYASRKRAERRAGVYQDKASSPSDGGGGKPKSTSRYSPELQADIGRMLMDFRAGKRRSRKADSALARRMEAEDAARAAGKPKKSGVTETAKAKAAPTQVSSMQRGPKGGVFVVVNGRKVYGEAAKRALKDAAKKRGARHTDQAAFDRMRTEGGAPPTAARKKAAPKPKKAPKPADAKKTSSSSSSGGLPDPNVDYQAYLKAVRARNRKQEAKARKKK